MNRYFLSRSIGSLFVAFFSLQFTRLVFYLNLSSYFEASFTEIIHAFVLGFRFDAVAIGYVLGPFFLLLPFTENNRVRAVAKWYFVVALGVLNLLNCIDAEFFKFMARRSTDDLFEFAFLSDDIFNIAPSLIGFFWYLLVAFGFTALLSYFAINKLLSLSTSAGNKNLFRKALWLIPTVGLLVLFARGGFQRIPLTIIDASTVSPPHLNSVVLNTPFTIIKTLGKPELEEFKYPEPELAELEPISYPKQNKLTATLKSNNVVLIILESLSTEYVGALNGLSSGYTPFIDSLCSESLVFTDSYANGHRSIEGIAAIAASIPTLMYEPFTTSRYAENGINSLANLLAEKGYHSSFMHGGNKNSMNFESFSAQAGYDLFYDRDDYPHPNEHYDGVWGISDHYFLSNCVDKYNEFQKPFFSTIFTLSSHHPYTIPSDYQDRFPKGTLPIHESIGYADQSLKEFFQKASEQSWYDSTLFVITADHTSLSEHDFHQTRTGSLRIPLILFHPRDTLLQGVYNGVVQQADIMPTVLDLLGYEKPFFAFGTSAFDSSASRMAIAFKHDQYQLLKDNQLVCFDGEKTTFVYDLSTDSLLQDNVLDNADHSENLAYLKSFVQNYSLALNKNLMTFEAWTESKK